MRLRPVWAALAASLSWWIPSALPAAAVVVESRISASSDDAEQDVGSGALHLSSSDIELVTDAGTLQVVGLRFPALAIPNGATIENAWVQFQVDESSTDAAVLTIRAQSADDAPTFSSGNPVMSRPLGSAAVVWTPPAWPSVGAAGADQRTPGLASVIQEVVSRPGWTSGNALVLIVDGSGRRTAEAVDGAPSAAPLLHVEYAGGGGGGNLAPAVTLSAPADHAMFGVGDGVVFGAGASDPEDGDLSASLAWSSNRDGTIGFGAAFTSSSLSAGVHTLTASVVDSGGRAGSASRQIEVASDRHVLVGAGDISECSSAHDSDTAALLDGIFGTVITVGDNVYNSGTLAEFESCYGPTWGRHKGRTRPATGNHDYDTANAAGYYAYFGAAAGPPPNGWYSYDAGAWHIVVLNSECAKVGGCTRSSPQGAWLQADLAAHPAACTLAITHKARFGSGPNGDHTILSDLWQILYENGADVVLSGHDHNYERFDPQNPNGQADPARGIRQFIIGMGGAGLSDVGTPHANSVISNGDTYGVFELTLRATSYDWRFVPEPGGSFSDAGSAACVGPPPANVTLGTSTSGPGSVTLSPPGGSYPYGQNVSVTAVPDSGAGFTGFSGALSGTANPQSLQMNGDKAITAAFAALVSLGVSTSGPGSVTLSPPGGSYLPGTAVSLTAVPGPSAVFSGWGGALSGSTNPQSLTLNADAAVSAAFTQLHAVAVAAVGPGGVALSPPGGSYPSGASVTVTATPDASAVFLGWSGDLAGTTNPADLLVDGAKSVTGTFAALHQVGVVTTGPGSVALDPPGGTYPAGTVVSVSATPDAGAVFTGFGGALGGTASPQLLTVTADATISAGFATAYSLVVSSSDGGAVSVSPASGPYLAGSLVTLTATPRIGYRFDAWGGNVSDSENPLSLVMDGDKAVSASFVPTGGVGCGIGPELCVLLPILAALRRGQRRATATRFRPAPFAS
jgi:hypothetical protein